MFIKQKKKNEYTLIILRTIKKTPELEIKKKINWKKDKRLVTENNSNPDTHSKSLDLRPWLNIDKHTHTHRDTIIYKKTQCISNKKNKLIKILIKNKVL